MSRTLRGFLSAHYIILVRSMIAIFGCMAVGWGIVEFPAFWRDSPIQRIARQIISGEQFKIETLIGQEPTLLEVENSTYCRPAAIRSAAVIRLRIAEQEIAAGGQAATNEQASALRRSIRVALSCSPADPFLWVVLFSVEAARVGVKPESLEYLRNSYRLGPNEGWIAWKRNPIAFSIFQQLPADLREMAIREFVGLVESDFIDEAVDILTGPAWQVRDLILLRLAAVSQRRRLELAKALYRRGYDIPIPGVDRSTPRPWT